MSAGTFASAVIFERGPQWCVRARQSWPFMGVALALPAGGHRRRL